MSHIDAEACRSWLRQRCLDVGFSRVGFASCAPFESERVRLETWIPRAVPWMPYLGTVARLDPKVAFPEACTALVGFFPYARPQGIPGRTPGSARLSRYLWGPDYHGLLKARLGQVLAEARERWAGLEGRVCVDTAPVLERQLAVRAGLGWQGKNTLLIAGKGGSWGFLGILLLNVLLPTDPPFEGHRCGSCRACLDACPTGALEPFQLDPARCMTTFTLETESAPPPPVASAIGATGWVAGCDRCQEVCPWNRAPLWGDETLWGGPETLHDLPLEALELNLNQYKKAIRNSALRRVRHRHWLRNLRLVRDSHSD